MLFICQQILVAFICQILGRWFVLRFVQLYGCADGFATLWRVREIEPVKSTNLLSFLFVSPNPLRDSPCSLAHSSGSRQPLPLGLRRSSPCLPAEAVGGSSRGQPCTPPRSSPCLVCRTSCAAPVCVVLVFFPVLGSSVRWGVAIVATSPVPATADWRSCCSSEEVLQLLLPLPLFVVCSCCVYPWCCDLGMH
jgi:hypothetical protein